MKKDTSLKSPERRKFFRKAGIGAGAAGAIALGLRDEPAKAAEMTGGGARGASYRETEHVKTAYRVARF